MSRLKRSDVARAVKSLERCVEFCKGLPSNYPGFTRVNPIMSHLQQAIEYLTNDDDCYDSLEFNYYLKECNEELRETFRL